MQALTLDTRSSALSRDWKPSERDLVSTRIVFLRGRIAVLDELAARRWEKIETVLSERSEEENVAEAKLRGVLCENCGRDFKNITALQKHRMWERLKTQKGEQENENVEA